MTKAQSPTMPLGPGRAGGGSEAVSGAVGEWRIEGKIAEGGFGTVYAVTHVTSGAPGALKLLHPHLVDSEATVARLLREAEVLARLRHPNVVELLAAGVDGGRPFIVMERLVGVDLGSELALRGRVAPADALALIEPVCAALALAHEHGIIHRDVKASNVFLCAGTPRRVVLLDFGIARVAGATDLTMSRQVVGTPASMAPEQIQGGAVDERCDVYGLGVLTYHLLVGRMPFEESSLTMAEYLHLHARRPRVSASAPVAGELDEVVARAMAIDPAARHPGPLAYLAALRGAIVAEAARPARAGAVPGILVAAVARPEQLDERGLDDLEELVPAASRALAAHDFRLALDLGDAALFVPARAGTDGATACAAACAAFDLVAARPGAVPGVTVAMAVHLDMLELAGDHILGGALADPARWPVAAERPGVVASAAALDAPGSRVLR